MQILPEHKILVAILLLGILMRLLLMPHIVGGFFEPDNYVYYSMAQQAVAQGSVPSLDALSGFPIHAIYDEKPLLIAWATGAYSIFKYLGISLMQSMQILPILFGLLGIILAYLFTEQLTGNKKTALWAAFFFAVIPAAVFKTSAGEWRGESFVPILLASALALLAIRKPSLYGGKPWLRIGGSILLIAIAYYTWNGGVYAVAAYLLILGMLLTDTLLKHPNKIALISIGGMVLAALGALMILPALSGTNFGSSLSEVQPPTFFTIAANIGFLILLVPLGIWYLFKEYDLREEKVAYYAVWGMIAVSIPLMLYETRTIVAIAMPACIFGAIGIQYLLEKRHTSKYLLALIAVFSMASSVYAFSVGSQPAGINPQELAALAWLRNNTAQNATVLTFWQDGSLVEGLANRTSYSDSVVGLDKGAGFERFLFENQGNLSYIAAIKPQYLLIRHYWLNITLGMELQAHISTNTSLNGTNLKMLEAFPSNIIEGNLILLQIFHNNDSAIYKAYYLGQQPQAVQPKPSYPTTTQPTTTSITTSSSTTTIPIPSSTSTQATTTIPIQQDGITNYNATIYLPNPSYPAQPNQYIYIPVMTTNTISTQSILAYAPIALAALQRSLAPANSAYGFNSIYTYEGQMQYANLGKQLLAGNSSLAQYEENAT